MVSFPFATAAADGSGRKWSQGNRLDDSPSDSRPEAGCKPSGVEARRYDSRRRESCVNGVGSGVVAAVDDDDGGARRRKGEPGTGVGNSESPGAR